MKSRMLAVAAIVTTVLPAAAADIPIATSVRAPVIHRPTIFNWTGVYIGVMGGYAKGAGDSEDLDGGFAGGTLGYNWQAPGSPLVVGIEGDGAWTNFGQSVSATAGGVVVTASTEAKAIATVRARLGYAFDRSLIYVTGGGAWARNEIAVTAAVAGLTAGITDTKNHTGYAVGGGFEVAFMPNWSAKVEYLYLGYGSKDYFQSQLGVGVASGDLDIHTIKVGVNYRFGG